MFNKVFGEVTFDCSWETKTEIVLWGKTYSITVAARSYYEKDGITAEQESSYLLYKNEKSEKRIVIETLLSQYFNNSLDHKQLSKQLTPTILGFRSNGDCALMFDDAEDPDNGIAVLLYPKEDVMTQDDYLMSRI